MGWADFLGLYCKSRERVKVKKAGVMRPAERHLSLSGRPLRLVLPIQVFFFFLATLRGRLECLRGILARVTLFTFLCTLNFKASLQRRVRKFIKSRGLEHLLCDCVFYPFCKDGGPRTMAITL